MRKRCVVFVHVEKIFHRSPQSDKARERIRSKSSESGQSDSLTMMFCRSFALTKRHRTCIGEAISVATRDVCETVAI
jgi:hypothetical protein